MACAAASPTPLIAARPNRIDGSDRREARPRLVDVGREDGNPGFLAVAEHLDDPVGGTDLGGKVGGEEIDRVVRLEVGGLVGDEGVRDGVGLVEAVAGEGLDQGPEVLRLLLRGPVLDGPADELLALGHHDLALLLADRLAQEVGLGQRVAGDELRDAHDLLLVDQDPERLGEDRLELGQRVGHARAAAAAHVVLDGARVERSRAVQRVQGREIGEHAGLGPAQEVAHAARVELEDARGAAGAKELVGRLVVERQVIEVDVDAEPLLHGRPGRVEDVERDETEEVDLQQPHLLDGVHVELRRDFVLVGPVERQELDDRLRRDDDAGRVDPGVAREALEPLGDLDHPRDRLVGRHRLFQAGRVPEGTLEIDVRSVRYELGDAVAERHRQRQHARHVAHGELGLQLREGHDLGHVFAPVLSRSRTR